MRIKNKIQYKRIIAFIALLIMVLTNMMPIYAISFEKDKVIKLEANHECISVLKYKDRDVLKNVFYVCYRDPKQEKGVQRFA